MSFLLSDSCEDVGGPTTIFFTYQDQCCEAICVRAVEGGLLLCIPRAGIDAQVFKAAEEEGFPGLIVPFTEVTVGVHHASSKRTLNVVVFDVDAFDLSCISKEPPEFFGGGSITKFGAYRGKPDYPSGAGLLDIALNFVQIGGAWLDQYLSAAEDLPIAAPNGHGRGFPVDEGSGDDHGSLLRQLLAQAEVTQRTVTGLKDKVDSMQHMEARLDRLELGRKSKAPPATPPSGVSAPQLFHLDAAKPEEDRLAHLRGLAGRGPTRLGDLGGGPTPAAAAIGLGGTRGTCLPLRLPSCGSWHPRRLSSQTL